MPRFLLINHCVLFICCSIYLGTGVSLIFFQFPLEPKLTPDNYYLVFVEPVANATRFFTHMTIVMLVTAFTMIITEWFTGLRWIPVIVMVGIISSTLVEVLLIFDYNRELAEGIRDPARLKTVFANWASLNRIRVSLWTIQWLAMMYWFYRLAFQARADR